MSFNVLFRDVGDRTDLGRLTDFLMNQSLDLNYPNFEDWVARAKLEIEFGYKRAILALSDGLLVGDLIIQPHKTLPNAGEIKNLRIHPKARDRMFASFMLRQAEIESSRDYDFLVCDARKNQHTVVNFLIANGYTLLFEKQLYDKNETDVIFVKPLCVGETEANYRARQLFSN